MKTPDKPIKPRRMWAHKQMPDCLEPVRCKYWNRPVLVIDLSPESVEAMVLKLAEMYTLARPVPTTAIWAARHQLATLGIKPVKKGGRK